MLFQADVDGTMREGFSCQEILELPSSLVAYVATLLKMI